MPAREETAVGRLVGRLAPWWLGFTAYWLAYAGAFRLSRPDVPWSSGLRGAAFAVLPEALLAPAVLALARRRPWSGPKVAFFLSHLAAAVLFGACTVGAMAFAFAAEGQLTTGRWSWPSNPQILVFRAVMTLVVFCALASIGHAVELARSARREAERAARAETLGAEARLAALRAQLNPHFVSNLLHSLLGLVTRDPGAATAGLERLGDLLRYASRAQRRDGDLVPLRDEVGFVDDYLALEQLRLGRRLRVERRIDEGALDRRVPAFVLQPLVENAVRHAVAPRAEGGTIAITIEASAGTLSLRLEDDGRGPAPAAPPGDGLGLGLIRERLAALYGGRAALRTGRSPQGGFVAEVVLPGDAAPDGEEES